MIRNIVFDFDGTLADTAPLIVKTMQRTIAELGLPPKSDAECRATIGVRLIDTPGVLWPGIEGIGERYADVYRRIFEGLKRPFSTVCFPGVSETLRALHAEGYGMAIASSRSRRSLEEYIGQFSLGECFRMVVGGDDVERGKPAPDPVLAILEACGWKAQETLTVGDAAVDILMGRAAGTATCGVTYGNGTRGELSAAGAAHIIDSFSQLPTEVLS